MIFARLRLAARALRALAGLATSAVRGEGECKVAFRGDRAARRSRAKYGWRGPFPRRDPLEWWRGPLPRRDPNVCFARLLGSAERGERGLDGTDFPEQAV